MLVEEKIGLKVAKVQVRGKESGQGKVCQGGFRTSLGWRGSPEGKSADSIGVRTPVLGGEAETRDSRVTDTSHAKHNAKQSRSSKFREKPCLRSEVDLPCMYNPLHGILQVGGTLRS